MFKKNFFITLTLLSLLALTLLGLPAQSYAQQGGSGENFIFVNYIGQELFLDLDDVTYTVPGTNTMPEGGRLSLQLAPGEHKYAANVPGVRGSAGEFTITPGGYVAKAARLDKTPPVVDRNGILLEKPQDYVDVFDFDPFAPAVEATPVVDTWQPAAALPGQSSIVFVNYIGDQLTVDLNGQIYTVAPPANGIPGRLQIQVAPGEYRYTASVPNGSLNDDLTLVPGQVVGLTFSSTLPPEPEYEIGEEFDFIQPVDMMLYQEDLTGQAGAAPSPQPEQTQPEAVPQSPPAPEQETTSSEEGSPAGGLLVKNYAGDTLTFTIDNQAYTILPREERVISLSPGSYSYTASRPSVATTGTVDLQAGQQLQLSVAINVAGDVLSVYQN